MQSNGTFWERPLFTDRGTDAECAIDQPYVYNATSQVMVSFDDARSFEAKGEFIKNFGLRGYAMWEAAGDYKDILIDAIRKRGGY